MAATSRPKGSVKRQIDRDSLAMDGRQTQPLTCKYENHLASFVRHFPNCRSILCCRFRCARP